jgi:hypothetical protein
MPLTPNYNIFYPGSSDPWDMAVNLNAMANSIDVALADIGGVKVAESIPGLGVGDFDGQFGWLSNIDCGLRWSGTAWLAIQGQKVADTAARALLFPSPVAGDTVFRVDVGYTEKYSGSTWIAAPGSAVTASAVPVSQGGTGATTLAEAQTNLSVKILDVYSVTKFGPQATSIAASSAADITDLEITHATQSSTNKVLLMAQIGVTSDTSNALIGSIRFTADGTAIGVGALEGVRPSVSTGGQFATSASASGNKALSSNFLYSPGSTSSIVYKVQIFNNNSATQTHYINRRSDDSNGVGSVRTISTLTLMEVSG